MAEGRISPEVRQFVGDTIEAAEQLDILLLLHRERTRSFTAMEVSQAVFTVPAAATLRLEGLVARGLLTTSGDADPRYQYAPRDPTTGARVDALAAAYKADRVGVIKLIFARPPDPAQTFADAFRIKGRE